MSRGERFWNVHDHQEKEGMITGGLTKTIIESEFTRPQLIEPHEFALDEEALGALRDIAWRIEKLASVLEKVLATIPRDHLDEQ